LSKDLHWIGISHHSTQVTFYGKPRETRLEEEVKQENQELIDFVKQVVVREDFEVTKDTITQYIVHPVKLHTNISMLLIRLQIK